MNQACQQISPIPRELTLLERLANSEQAVEQMRYRFADLENQYNNRLQALERIVGLPEGTAPCDQPQPAQCTPSVSTGGYR